MLMSADTSSSALPVNFYVRSIRHTIHLLHDSDDVMSLQLPLYTNLCIQRTNTYCSTGNGVYGNVFEQVPMGGQPLQSTSRGLQDLLATPSLEMDPGLDAFGSDDMWVDFFPGLLTQSPA
jgi:hypothetical protein